MATSKKTPNPDAVIAAMEHRFAEYGGGDLAKRLRLNTTRASSTARELAEMCGTKASAERDFLLEAAGLLSQLAGQFEVAQRKAVKAQKTREKAFLDRHAEEVRQTIALLFGEQPNPA